ncbi:MAG TPA: CorA family divalent cation transporter, partial [Spongiibacteraceae bacterium]|nr:CorA family divalent cation transporter [Spongiibacteraceae bacterium]
MLRAMLIDDKGGTQIGAEQLVRDWQQHRTGFLWLDLFPQDGPMDTPWLQEFGIHSLAIQDAQRSRHPPKYEFFGDLLFVLLRGMCSDSESLDVDTIQIALFFGDNFLITRHERSSPSIDRYWELCIEDRTAIPADPNLLGWHISMHAASRYLDLMNNFEPRLGVMEDKMFRRPRDTLLNQLVANRTSLR